MGRFSLKTKFFYKLVKMRYILFLLLFILSSFSGSKNIYSQTFTPESIKDIKANCADCYVSNQDNLLSETAVNKINSMLRALENETSAQILVIAINDIGTYSAQGLAMELFNKWKIGQEGKDNGAIIILAMNNRETFISTGYGLEGALTDAISTRIVNNYMNPYFKENDIDNGMIKGVEQVSNIIIKEFRTNGFEGLAKKDSVNFTTFFLLYIALTLIFIIFSTIKISKQTKPFGNYEKEEKISAFNKASFSWKIIGVLFPIMLLYIVIWYSLFFRPKVRRTKINCNKCSNPMHLLNEKEDDLYLSASQIVEENLKSKDYDVWLCDNCHNTIIYSFDNRLTSYTVCNSCNAKTTKQTDDKIIKNPSAFHNGKGQKTYTCKNCGKITTKEYIIPKGSSYAAGGAIMGAGMGRGGGGFGGFSGGGGWGGGMSGGGGGGGRF